MATSKNNPVSQVLITSGNAAVLAAGSQPSALAVGQLGFFNYEGHISIDGTNAGKSRKFYMAVGIDPGATGALTDIAKSAGQYIQRDEVAHINARCYSPARVKIVDVTGFTVKCETDYGIRIGFTSALGMANQGYTRPTKYFSALSSCCVDDCATCPKGDCNDVALQLVNSINNDPEALLTAQLLDYTTTPGTPVVVATPDYATWVAAAIAAAAAIGPDEPVACLGIRITGKAEATGDIQNNINQGYLSPRGMNFDVNLVEGFNCNGTVTEFQTIIYEQGAGVDIMQLEYEVEGYNTANPYKQSMLLHTTTGAQRLATASGKYLTIALGNDLKSAIGTFSEENSPHETVLAIPCADTTTRTSVGAFLNAIFAPKFDSLVDDLATCVDCTTPNTQDSRTDSTDGIA